MRFCAASLAPRLLERRGGSSRKRDEDTAHLEMTAGVTTRSDIKPIGRRNKTDTAISMGDTEESPKEDAETDGTAEEV